MFQNPIWLLYTASSVLTPIWIVASALKGHNTVFGMLVSICSNKLNLVIFVNFLLVMLVQFCNLVVKVFFGDIRIIEIQYIIEKAQKKIFYLLLLSIVLRNTFDIYKMVGILVLFLFCILHWLLNKRSDYLVSRGSREVV